jgi:hypothetical protein
MLRIDLPCRSGAWAILGPFLGSIAVLRPVEFATDMESGRNSCETAQIGARRGYCEN